MLPPFFDKRPEVTSASASEREPTAAEAVETGRYGPLSSPR